MCDLTRIPPTDRALFIFMEVSMETVEELASAHWKFIKDLLIAHGENEETINKIDFHYKSAFVHGYKHCQQEVADDIS